MWIQVENKFTNIDIPRLICFHVKTFISNRDVPWIFSLLILSRLEFKNMSFNFPFLIFSPRYEIDEMLSLKKKALKRYFLKKWCSNSLTVRSLHTCTSRLSQRRSFDNHICLKFSNSVKLNENKWNADCDKIINYFNDYSLF